MRPKTLEDYFRAQFATYEHCGTVPVIDHGLRVEFCDGYVRFYIHPANTGGDTCNFELRGNVLSDDARITYPSEN